MTPEQLNKWFMEKPILEVLHHVGNHGGETSIEAARIIARRAAEEVEELEAKVAAFTIVSRHLMGR